MFLPSLVSTNPRLSGRPGQCNPAGSPGSATGSFCGLMRGAHVILDLLDSIVLSGPQLCPLACMLFVHM